MRITKEQVLEAIYQEPLKRQDLWIDKTYEAEGRCPVCVVGGVLRRGGVEDKEISKEAVRACGGELIVTGTPSLLLDDGKYLNALSCLFEQQHRDDPLVNQEDREELASFVKEYFPDEFEV